MSDPTTLCAVLAGGASSAIVDLYTRRVPNALTLTIGATGVGLAAAHVTGTSLIDQPSDLQLPTYATDEALRRTEAAYFAASVDAPDTNARFAQSLELDFPILSDPSRDVARAYGVLGASGLAQRARVT